MFSSLPWKSKWPALLGNDLRLFISFFYIFIYLFLNKFIKFPEKIKYKITKKGGRDSKEIKVKKGSSFLTSIHRRVSLNVPIIALSLNFCLFKIFVPVVSNSGIYKAFVRKKMRRIHILK